jgi:lipoyl(octanoyl) transferase
MPATLILQSPILVRRLGRTDFAETSLAMQRFTAERQSDTPDEIWLTEHNPVYTLGLNRKNVRMPTRDDIAVIETDRGGKITYHGPGQVIVYVLLDLKRAHLTIRKLVSALENVVIRLLAEYGVEASAKADAPGVYVQEAKVAALGLRIKKDCCYHGLSLNVNMDLSPFSVIDPCGYVGLKVTQMKDLGIDTDLQTIGDALLEKLLEKITINLANGHTHD